MQRSFRKELFEEAALRLAKSCIKTSSEIERFKALADNAYQIAGKYSILFYRDIPLKLLYNSYKCLHHFSVETLKYYCIISINYIGFKSIIIF